MQIRITVVAIAVMAAGALSAPIRNASGEAPRNAIERENRRAGSARWRSRGLDTVIQQAKEAATDEDGVAPGEAAFPLATLPYGRTIGGYASKDSIDQGEPIELHVSTLDPSYNVQIYRMGWYGGDRARLFWSTSGRPGVYYPAPTPDANGTAAATWPVSVTVGTDASWTSGIYIAKLTTSSDTEYATWVIRNDRSLAPILFQVATSTYQAYEAWGGASLYQPAIPAVKVSYDRPYYAGDGTGLLFSGAAQTAAFLEREGYDVSYATSGDTHSNPRLMDNHQLFVSAFHDEYWSKQMRDNLDSWIAAGKNVAFLSANNMYWQIRYESSASGNPNRVIVCYKLVSDPIAASNPGLSTVWWHSPPLNRPESAVTGNSYDESRTDFGWHPWVVSNANHWFYSGTGLRNGDALPSVVGTEWDLIPGGAPPSNVTELSNSPMAPSGTRQQATLRLAPSGGQVFDAGSLRYALYLDNYTADPTTAATVQQMTRNLVAHLVTTGGPPSTTTTSTTTPPTTTTTPGNTTTIYEAENAQRSTPNPTIETAWPGYTGTGLLGSWKGDGQYIRFTINNTTAGTATLTFRYTAGNTTDNRILLINGTPRTITFPKTTTWGDWQTITTTAPLTTGTNTIELQYATTAGSTTWINLDNLTVTTP